MPFFGHAQREVRMSTPYNAVDGIGTKTVTGVKPLCTSLQKIVAHTGSGLACG